MILFKYEAFSLNGDRSDGMIFAESYKNAYEILKSRRYFPLKIKSFKPSSRKLDPQDVLIFFLHLDFQLKCGMSINEAIESFIESQGNKILKASLIEILSAMHNGESIGDSFERCGKIFDPSIIGLLKSAQETGKIADVVGNIIEFLKFQNEWKNNVKRAIAYPLFTLLVAIFVMIFTITILGPQILGLIRDNMGEDQLPTFTIFILKILPEFSIFLYILCFILLVQIPCMMLFKKGKKILLKCVMKISKINELVTKICLCQFYKTLSIALRAKLDFIAALKLSIDTIKIEKIKSALEDIENLIESGYSISESFIKSKIISSDVITIIYVGENGNNLAESFEHISDNECREILFNIKSLGQNLSIGLTLMTGMILIFILCSLFFPIYSFIEVTGQ